MHIHKLPRKIPDWKVMDNIEVNNLMEDIDTIVKVYGGYIKNLQIPSKLYLQKIIQCGEYYRMA